MPFGLTNIVRHDVSAITSTAGGWGGLSPAMGTIKYHFPFTGEHLWMIKHWGYFLKIWPKSDNAPNFKNCTQYVAEA